MSAEGAMSAKDDLDLAGDLSRNGERIVRAKGHLCPTGVAHRIYVVKA
jgi:hypothetical protein